jgi:hypothetical protein
MTVQMADIILIDGEKLPLFSTPLQSYFNEDNPKPGIFGMRLTANWRGYVAVWEISEDTLYLVDISIPGGNADVSLATIFPDSPGKVKADWYSGTLRIPRGKCIEHMNFGYGFICEEDLMIEVENGAVKSREIIKHKYKSQNKA